MNPYAPPCLVVTPGAGDSWEIYADLPPDPPMTYRQSTAAQARTVMEGLKRSNPRARVLGPWNLLLLQAQLEAPRVLELKSETRPAYKQAKLF